MSEDQIGAILSRVRRWPLERQRELAELASEIDAEIAADVYRATADELAAIDEGLGGEIADDATIEAAFAAFRRK